MTNIATDYTNSSLISLKLWFNNNEGNDNNSIIIHSYLFMAVAIFQSNGPVLERVQRHAQNHSIKKLAFELKIINAYDSCLPF